MTGVVDVCAGATGWSRCRSRRGGGPTAGEGSSEQEGSHILATDLAGVSGPDLPLEVSAIDSFGSVTDAPERSLTVVARQQVSLAQVLAGEEQLCDVLDRCLGVSRFLLEQSPSWGV